MIHGWLGKKYDDLLRKNENYNIRGKMWKIFTVPKEKNIILEKGGGTKI